MLTISSSIAYAWTGPNYFNHWESPLEWFGLYHHGEMQIQPSHRDEGYNYAQGWFIFTNGPEGAVTTTTPMGTSPWDSSYLTAYKKYRDYWSLDPSLPKIGLTWGAVKVPVGSSSWPTV